MTLFVFAAAISVFASVVTVSEVREKESGDGGGRRRRGGKGNRLAVKYCGVCQLHHDVLGITRSLITLN